MTDEAASLQQSMGDPDAKASTIGVVSEDDAGKEPTVLPTDDPRTFLVKGDVVEALARRLALLEPGLRAYWWDAAYCRPLNVTVLHLLWDEDIHAIREDWFFEDMEYNELGNDSWVNLDDLALMDQNLGLLGDSQEFARRK